MRTWVWLITGALVNAALASVWDFWMIPSISYGIGIFVGLRVERLRWLEIIKEYKDFLSEKPRVRVHIEND